MPLAAALGLGGAEFEARPIRSGTRAESLPCSASARSTRPAGCWRARCPCSRRERPTGSASSRRCEALEHVAGPGSYVSLTWMLRPRGGARHRHPVRAGSPARRTSRWSCRGVGTALLRRVEVSPSIGRPDGGRVELVARPRRAHSVTPDLSPGVRVFPGITVAMSPGERHCDARASHRVGGFP
jgi:hypothetical protein